MSGKKHIFKMKVDDQRLDHQDDHGKYYRVKLVGENGEEVVLNQSCFAAYEISGQGQNFEYYVAKNHSFVTNKIKLENAVIDIVEDDKGCHQLLLRDKTQDDDGIILPKCSWKLDADENIRLVSHKQLYISTDPFFSDDIKLMDSSGKHVATLLHNNATVNGIFGFFFGESAVNLPHVTVLEGYQNINNKHFLIYFSDKDGYPVDNGNESDKSIIERDCIDDTEIFSSFFNASNIALENMFLSISNLSDVISSKNDLELLTHPADSQLQTLVEHLSDDKLVNLLDQLDISRFKVIADKLADNKTNIICDNTLKELEQCKVEKAEMSQEIAKVSHELEECNRLIGEEVWK